MESKKKIIANKEIEEKVVDIKNQGKKEKLEFSKIEILFMIVLVALLMVAGIMVFTVTTNKQNEQNLKKDAKHLALLALNEYSYHDMHENSDDIVLGSDGTTKGMCITLKALDKHDDYKNLKGYFVIEEDSEGQIKISVWVTDGNLIIDGYEQNRIEELTKENGLVQYTNEDFEKRVESSFTGATLENGGFYEKANRYETSCITKKID